MAHSLPLVLPHDAAPLRTAGKHDNIRARTNWLRRLYGALVEARQRQADREIARYLEATGGKFTDSIEREILRRLDLS